ncbi:MAG TPA: hypothetical protein VGV17_07755 [Bosea sp. (in: a-proteobacteria)]|jgi:hypothetical protein|uniref:hypothetical protein n=1 Tax=Bosea sp. (in: a-proteobacteria) TaxID=1871050 RepID=UPI002DDD5960|nr:hypothetical protein [Bosea sp. (in: a-proteobacteria)]HEV2553635.1 hypothetical protein [Bosea sp. (in: a-proteobacteria)]
MTEVEEDTFDDSRLVTLSELVARKMHSVNNSQMQLSATLGRMPGETTGRVIIGIVDLAVEVESLVEDPASAPLLVELKLPVENVAFLLANLTADFANVCEALARLSSSETAPEKARMQLIAYYLQTMRDSIQLAEKVLDGMPMLEGQTHEYGLES